MSAQDVLIRIQSTPNPNAWKFVLDRPVLLEGKANYSSLEEAGANRLASELLSIEGIKQVHFFTNVITITHQFDAEPDQIKSKACSVIQTRLPVHDPSVTQFDEKKELRKTLSPELQKIEEILDRTIRPGLQGDGGDLEIVKLDNKRLFVHYVGACGTCPSSTEGTLMAIDGILKDEYDPEIEVIPV
jgi:NFU1 iron-sulfur cluster scaffold homolog, mitochondrial